MVLVILMAPDHRLVPQVRDPHTPTVPDHRPVPLAPDLHRAAIPMVPAQPADREVPVLPQVLQADLLRREALLRLPMITLIVLPIHWWLPGGRRAPQALV